VLSISRDDVDRYNVTEFDVKDRFIKLPIVNYLKLLPSPDGNGSVWDNTNRPQIALINAINNPKYRFVVAALSRRLGKTFIANIIGQLVTLIPGSNVLIMSPNYVLSSISFELQRKFINTFDIEVEKNNLKDKIIELKNGSTIRMGSITTVDSCVGRSYDLIIFDEAALGADAENAFNVSLRPTLDKPTAKAIFISTPRGKNNWFSRFYQRGFSTKFPQWVSLHADYTENERMKESDVAEARAGMSQAEFEQEYLASFTTFEGQIYRFDSVNCIKEFEHKDGVQYFAGLDPGFKDPTALCVIAYDPSTETYHILDEYLDNEAVTQTHAAIIQEFILKYGLDPIFIDSAAAQFAADLAYTYEIATIKAKKEVNAGISFVQNIIENNRLFVSPDCVNTLAMLDQYRWKMDTKSEKEKPLHDEYSHMADAMRYALYSFTI
jgi:hypothetical protein